MSAHTRVLDVADVAAAACRAERIPSLVGTLDDARAGAMLSLSPRADPDRVLGGLAARITGRAGGSRDSLVIGVGAAVGSIRDVRRSFLEASQVADVAAEHPDGWGPGDGSGRPPFYRLVTCACGACCTCSATTRGCRLSWSGNWARCSPNRTRRCSACSPLFSPPEATRRRRPSTRTWPGRRSTNGSGGSSASWVPTWVRLNRARRCTWRCWPWRRPGRGGGGQGPTKIEEGSGGRPEGGPAGAPPGRQGRDPTPEAPGPPSAYKNPPYRIPGQERPRQASRTWLARSTTGPSQLHGKLIQRSVRFQT